MVCPGAFLGVGSSVYIGVLEGLDEASLLVRTPTGETLYLPLRNVMRVDCIEPPPSGPPGTLLRPADAPPEDTDRLLRPARKGGEGDPARLPRPVIHPRARRERGE